MSSNLLIFTGVAFVAVATPGPTVLLALNNGARWGLRAALPGILGGVLSDGVLTLAVALGAGALLLGSALGFSMLKWLGVAYLAWMGLRLLCSRGGLAMPTTLSAINRPKQRSIFGRSFLVAATNPKGYLFMSALMPQFIDPTLAAGPQFLQLAFIFAAIDAAVMLAYAALGGRSRALLREHGMLWLDRVCGAALCTLAVSLALYGRDA